MPKKKPSKKYPLLSELPESEQRIYTGVLLEEIRSQNKGVMELVQTMGTGLRQEMKEMKSEISSQIEVTQQALGATRDELKQDIKITQMAVKSNKEEIIQIQKKLEEHDEQFKKIDKRFEQVDKRFDILENKMDRVADKVEHHDEEITFLKTAVAKS